MAFKKIGESLNFTQENILAPQIALADNEIAERFIKMAKNLKKIAPKANDFCYFHAIMMHAAESSLIDQMTGEPILNKNGQPVKGGFETFTNANGQESIRWVSADGIKAYKNANGDIFGEEELKKAYKKWIGKPLCRDHVSDSVDGIRGIIVDTYYDPKFKRVHALAAIDKKNYPDLARKVESGYSNSVSMGTGVAKSICYDCGNIAKTERDFCSHVRSRNCYGEINIDLNPIELSLVVNGADGLAKVKNIIASMNNYVKEKTDRIEEMNSTACINPVELQSLADNVSDMHKKITSIMNIYGSQLNKEQVKEAAPLDEINRTVSSIKFLQQEPEKNKDRIDALQKQLDELLKTEKAKEEPKLTPTEVQPVRSTTGNAGGLYNPDVSNGPPSWSMNPTNRFASENNEEGISGALYDEIHLLRAKLDNLNNLVINQNNEVPKKEETMNSARLKARAKNRYAYWQGGGGVNEPTPGKVKYPEMGDYQKIRDTEDKQMVGEPLETGSEGLAPGDLEVKKLHQRAENLEARRNERRAYWQGGGGVNEPTPGKVKYPEMGDYQKIRDTEDKQMVGKPEDLDAGTDGLAAGDLEIKKKLLRASLNAKFLKASNKDGTLNKNASRWDIYAGDSLILSATAAEIFEDEVAQNWDWLSSADYGRAVMKSIREDGFEHTAQMLKGAADEAPSMPSAPMGDVGADVPAMPAPEEATKPEGGMKGKVEFLLNDLEVKIDELRKLVSDEGKEDGLVDVEVQAPNESAPMEVAKADREEALVVQALLDDSADELALVSEKLSSPEVSDAAVAAAGQAVEDAEVLLSHASLVIEAAKKKMDAKKTKKKLKEEESKMKKTDLKKMKNKEVVKEDAPKQKNKKAEDILADALRVRAENRTALLSKAMEEDMSWDMADSEEVCDPAEEKKEVKDFEKMEAILKDLMEMPSHKDFEADDMVHDHTGDDCDMCDMAKDEHEEETIVMSKKELEKLLKEVKEDKAHDEMHVEESPMEHKEARRRAREQLVARAAESLGKDYQMKLDPQETQTEPTAFQAHPKGGTVTELTTKTPEAKVETNAEQHEKTLEVARMQATPKNIRDASSDVSRIVEGKVDAETVKYWKDFWNQAGEKDASQFGAELSKEFEKKKASEDSSTLRIKMKRAYDIALQAQKKGAIKESQAALDEFVDSLMAMNDAGFESMKRAVTQVNNLKKSAGLLPNVGFEPTSEPIQSSLNSDAGEKNLSVDLLKNLNWK